MRKPRRTEYPYLETPRGILSRGGLLFHTTTDDLERLYGEVLQHVTLEQLIDRAELWLTSHRAVTLWALIPLLVYLSMPVACLVGLVVFLTWKSVAPALGNAMLEKPIRLLSSVAGQLVGYVIAMSWLGASERYGALTAGLIAFALIRWQLLDYLFRPLTSLVHRRMFPLPVADQMLRAVIHSTAIQLKVRLPQFPSIARWMSNEDDEEET
jgi:hypothetical protein